MSSRQSSTDSSKNATHPGVDVSLVVPAYNEERDIEMLVREAATVLGHMNVSYELVIVNDGSTDSTGLVLKELREQISALRVITLRVNGGQHVASFVGMRESAGRLVILADADLAGALSALPRLLDAVCQNETCDIVSAVRRTRSVALYRSVGSRLVTGLINWMTGSKLRDPASPLRIYRRRVVDAIIDVDILAQNLPILTPLLGLRIIEIEIDVPSSGRSSRYRFLELMNLLLLAVLNFSSGTRTVLTLILLGALSTGLGIFGLLAMTVHGVVAQVPLGTNLLLLFVLLTVIGLQFTLMGGIAYKIERINNNLRFRKLAVDARYDE